jgi:hypothetical protein
MKVSLANLKIILLQFFAVLIVWDWFNCYNITDV